MSTVDKIRSALLQAIEARRPAGLLGAQAGAVIRNVAQDFSPSRHGYSKLKDFIAAEIPEVKVVAHTADDVYYGLQDSPEWRATELQMDLWKIWVSPAAPFVLCVNSETGAVAARRPSEPPTAEETHLQSPGQNFHRETARLFSTQAEIDDSERVKLQEIAASGENKWWTRWTNALRHGSPSEAERWWDFRTTRFREEFRDQLSKSGLGEDTIKLSEAQLMTSRGRGRRDSSSPTQRRPAAQRRALETLSRITQEVTRQMSEDELRLLKLPLGRVLDAVLRMKS